MVIEKSANVSAGDMVNKLKLAASKGTLKMYDANSGARWLYGADFNSTVRDFLAVTTCADLNGWLNENELLLSWRFPEPQSSDNGYEFTNKALIKDDVNSVDKPWLIQNPIDPIAIFDWYIPARYLARELIKDSPSLLRRRINLAEKVRELLTRYKIYKRGGKIPPQSETILKAFSNINFG